MVKSRKILKSFEDRRIGHDSGRFKQDINVYRWFAVFIKCGLELEGKTFSIRGKNHKLKFDTNHKWWKLIDLKSIKKSTKLIKSDYKSVPKSIDQLFNGMFLPKYRNLFNEKKTIIGEAVIFDNHTLMQVPDNYPIKSILSDIRHWYSQKEVKLRSNRQGKKKGETKGNTRGTADIMLDLTNEDVMKRLFHTLRIDQSMPDLTNLDIFFQRSKSLNKKFVIPEIVRSNKKGALGTRSTQTIRSDYDSQIRSTQRDIRFYKILLLNLAKGVFPKFDNLI
jgi:hypothetical protein